MNMLERRKMKELLEVSIPEREAEIVEIVGTLIRYEVDDESFSGDIDGMNFVEELLKSAENGKTLANFIRMLDESGLLGVVLPEIKTLQDYRHSYIHHPEGAYVTRVVEGNS